MAVALAVYTYVITNYDNPPELGNLVWCVQLCFERYPASH